MAGADLARLVCRWHMPARRGIAGAAGWRWKENTAKQNIIFRKTNSISLYFFWLVFSAFQLENWLRRIKKMAGLTARHAQMQRSP